MEFLSEYGLFLAKAVTIVIASLVIIGAIISAGQKGKSQQSGQITVTHVSEELKELEQDIRKETLSKEAYKAYLKSQKEQQKQKAKANKKAAKKKTAENEGESEPDTEGSASGKEKRLFVVDFEGDVQASAVENLREEITAILSVAEPDDEVLVRLESAGGMVHTYGLAASQLKRIKQQNIKLNIAVDEVAASGGYMMACVADKILAAPFAIIGSIGVIGQLPNFNRLLKHNKVDFEQHTAGEFKRTLTMFGENTDKAREKFKQELEETHSLFKAFIAENRSSLDVNKVATGEHWYGTQALELGLVDEISTSDDFIVRWAKEHSVFKVKYEIKKPLSERLPISLAAAIQHAVLNVWQRGENQKLFK